MGIMGNSITICIYSKFTSTCARMSFTIKENVIRKQISLTSKFKLNMGSYNSQAVENLLLTIL